MVASLLTPLTNGIQDERLFSRKSFGIFLQQWRKTTRFTTAWHRVEFNNIPDFGKTSIVDIPIKGHLVGRTYLVTSLPSIAGPPGVLPQYTYCHSTGHALLEDVQVMIGGRTVDRLDSRLLEVKDEFGTRREKVGRVNSMIGRSSGVAAGPADLYVHLPFWFSSNDPHLWFPIDAVNVDKLSVQVKMRSINGLAVTESQLDGDNAACKFDCTGRYVADPSGILIPGLDPTNSEQKFTEVERQAVPVLGETYLLVEYIYLDTYEANRLRVSPIEIPIPQHTILPVHDTGRGVLNTRVLLRIGNPTKCIYFFAQRPEADGLGNFFSTSVDATAIPVLEGPVRSRDEPITEMALVHTSGQVRYQTTYMDLFRCIMPALECVKAPIYNQYMYYIGFDVGNHMRRLGIPGGEANFDKMPYSELRLEFAQSSQSDVHYYIFIYAITYNILSIYGGRAGLLFAY